MKFSDSICLVETSLPIEPTNCQVFRSNCLVIIFGNYQTIINELHYFNITHYRFINLSKNSLMPLIDYSNQNCRIEYGAIIRDQVILGKDCVILMGAVINKGAIINEQTMIDMNAIIGSNAIIGKRCHIGAGAVIAGTMEPKSSTPVEIGDCTFIGANAVILEGIKIGKNVIIGASSVVTKNIPDNMVAYGNPCKIKRMTKQNDINQIVEELR